MILKKRISQHIYDHVYYEYFINEHGNYHGLLKKIDKYGRVFEKVAFKNGIRKGVKQLFDSKRFMYWIYTAEDLNYNGIGIVFHN